MANRVSYDDGTWVAVPLRDWGYGTGLVARSSPNGCILLYLFGPKLASPARLSDVQELKATDAIKVSRAGDLGIIQGVWPIIGKLDLWRREDWPMPQFIRTGDFGGRAWLVTYADDNPMLRISEELIPAETTGFERDALSGAGAVEIVLTRLLS